MQYACAILSSVACPTLRYFSTLSHKRHDFRGENVIDNKMRVSVFSSTFVWNIFHSKKNWARYLHSSYSCLHSSTAVFTILQLSSQFYGCLHNSTVVFTILQLSSQFYSCLHGMYPMFLSGFDETWNFSAYFRKYVSIKFHENPSSGSWVVPRGQMDRHDEAHSRFLRFCERT
jgi:hypothetical protein